MTIALEKSKIFATMAQQPIVKVMDLVMAWLHASGGAGFTGHGSGIDSMLYWSSNLFEGMP
jgi:hypothetical protein